MRLILIYYDFFQTLVYASLLYNMYNANCAPVVINEVTGLTAILITTYLGASGHVDCIVAMIQKKRVIDFCKKVICVTTLTAVASLSIPFPQCNATQGNCYEIHFIIAMLSCFFSDSYNLVFTTRQPTFFSQELSSNVNRDKEHKIYNQCQEDYSELQKINLVNLPNEIILLIFSFMDIGSLIRCAGVSKRMRVICHNNLLWEKFSFKNQKIPARFIEEMVIHGCKYINLSYTEILGDVNIEKTNTSVKYLVLDGPGNINFSEQMLRNCQGLTKLSLNNATLNSKLLNAINCCQLTTLNLCSARNISDYESLKYILESSKNVKDISFKCANTSISTFPPYGLSNHLIYCVVNFLASNVVRLSLSGQSHLNDDHVTTLVSRCKQLEELELHSARKITNKSLSAIICQAKNIVLLDIACTNIGSEALADLRLLPKLKKLNCLKRDPEQEEIESVKEKLPHVIVNQNKEQFSLDLQQFFKRVLSYFSFCLYSKLLI